MGEGARREAAIGYQALSESSNKASLKVEINHHTLSWEEWEVFGL